MSETPSIDFEESLPDSLPRTIEKSLWRGPKESHYVIGIDEAGRGPLAGPVVAAALTFSKTRSQTPPELARGITDSKQVPEAAREAMYANHIRGNPNLKYKVSVIDNTVIDKINILQATFLAMSSACSDLVKEIKSTEPSATFSILIDGNKVPPQLGEAGHECHAIIKGDSVEFLIAAASICAKVERDEIMRDIDRQFPMYGFTQHKGYPTGGHVAAIHRHGPCKHHRMTFAPLKTMKKSAIEKRPRILAVSPVADPVDKRAERLKRRNELKSSSNP
jgi:ribonuclease HII